MLPGMGKEESVRATLKIAVGSTSNIITRSIRAEVVKPKLKFFLENGNQRTRLAHKQVIRFPDMRINDMARRTLRIVNRGKVDVKVRVDLRDLRSTFKLDRNEGELSAVGDLSTWQAELSISPYRAEHKRVEMTVHFGTEHCCFTLEVRTGVPDVTVLPIRNPQNGYANSTSGPIFSLDASTAPAGNLVSNKKHVTFRNSGYVDAIIGLAAKQSRFRMQPPVVKLEAQKSQTVMLESKAVYWTDQISMQTRTESATFGRIPLQSEKTGAESFRPVQDP
ncbi:unnamed protein product [Amoebophrya sp. A120]|nr:unnamed protein product [Amoebophrya sp. A120]|eukprot:GSA120T00003464001.1